MKEFEIKMTDSKNLSCLVSTLLLIVVLHLNSSFAQSTNTMKGGYWYSDSGLKVSDIDPSYFTHLFCAFADLDNNTYQVTISSSNAPSFSIFTQTVQQKSPSVKTLLSIGGGGDRSAAFPAMASQTRTRKTFIDSSIQLARKNNFHGLDLDWEFPSSNADKTNLGLLLKEWRSAVTQESTTSGKPALLLSAAVAGSDTISPLQNYPGQELANNLDWVNVMAYDLYPSTSDTYAHSTQPPAPLKNPVGRYSGDEGVTKWINQLGLPPKKLALGLPFYGYKWLLSDPNNHGLFAPAAGGGGAVKYKDIKSVGGQVVFNSTFVTNYCYKGTDWYGYDDTQSVSAKVGYAKQRGMLGYFAWHIGQDSNWALSQAASQAWGS